MEPEIFQILSLTRPVIYDLKSKTSAAAVKLFYLTFINITLPLTGLLILEINFISKLKVYFD